MADMNRRDFLKASAAAGLSATPVASSLAQPVETLASSAAKPKRSMPRFGIWCGCDGHASAADLRKRYQELRKKGIDSVYIGGVDDREFEIIREAGIEVHCWMWTTNRGDEWIRKNHPDWYMVSRTGKSCFDQPPYVDYYRWISPVIPGVQNYLKDRVAELAKHPAVNGVHLDYIRYPDVILPKALWKNYNVDQTEEMPEYDFCYSKHTRDAFKKVSGRDPLKIEDPAHDQEWLHFRYDSVTNLVKKLQGVTKAHGKALTAAVFPTPRLARMICRQDWDRWPLDAACPMIYHSFYDEPVEWVGEMVLENIRTVDFPVVAGLYMPAFKSAEEFAKGLALVHKRGGHGVSLFGGVSDEMWKVFEKGIEAWSR